MGIGESGLNASLAISEAVAPSAPLKMASLFIAGMVTSIGDFLTIIDFVFSLRFFLCA